jgi:hypothetical protein
MSVAEITDGISQLDMKEENTLESLCEEMVGENIEICVKFMSQTINIQNCNPMGEIMEDIFYNHIKDKLDIHEGPKQASPDYYINREKEDGGYELELKTFKGSPGFDISNYNSFIDQLNQDGGVYRKFFKTKYIIFEYEEITTGFKIVKCHDKRLWEILSYNNKYPIPIQNKKNMWYNIRPGSINTWNDKSKTPHICIEAILKSILICPSIDDKETKMECIKKQWNDIKISHPELNLPQLE